MTFDEWWEKIGSGIVKLETEDNEEHAHRVTKAAWGFAMREVVIEWEKPYGLTDGRQFIERLRDMANNEVRGGALAPSQRNEVERT